jgi:hypothetical protein
MTAQEIIEARAPALAAANAGRIPALVTLASSRTNTRLFKDRTQEAIALRVLHMIVSDGRGGAAGPITSESEGSLSRSYAAPQGGEDLGATSFGQELQAMGRAHGAGLPFNRRMA